MKPHSSWKGNRVGRLEALAKDTRRRFHAQRPGLRPGDPYQENRHAMPAELWAAYHPKDGLVMLPWFLTRRIVEEWLELERPEVRPDLTDGWIISGPWRPVPDQGEGGR